MFLFDAGPNIHYWVFSVFSRAAIEVISFEREHAYYLLNFSYMAFAAPRFEDPSRMYSVANQF